MKIKSICTSIYAHTQYDFLRLENLLRIDVPIPSFVNDQKGETDIFNNEA